MKVLNAGGLILYPTDTVWGIGCDATNEKAVERIYRLKKRSDKKTMIILGASKKNILQYINQPDKSLFEYLMLTDKPTTVIYQYKKGLAENLIAEDNSIAIRICKEVFCTELIQNFGKPIVSTSANISGEKTAVSFSEIHDEIKNGVDYIVKYRQEEKNPAVPSTVIRWEKGKPVTVRP